MEPGPRLRAALDDVPTYAPGRAAPVVAGLTSYKLSSNENPYPPLPSVQAVLADAAGRVNRYPDMACTGLVAALSATFDVPVGDLATGTGSVGVAQQILQAVAGPGDEVVFAWRSFEAYPILVAVCGATAVRVPLLPDERHDLDAMARAITPRTRAVLVCSPNNPTGPAVRRDELEAFLDRVPGDVLVVLDEAYVEFVTDPEVPDGIDVYRGRSNVCVLRTFSKAYGLAGLRVGFAVAPERVAAALRKTAVPFGVSTMAQEAAVASLAARDELLERVGSLVVERSRLIEGLRSQGWAVPDSQANFVWLRTAGRTAEVAGAMEAAGVVVRPFATEGLRITVGEPEAVARVLDVAARLAAVPPAEVFTTM